MASQQERGRLTTMAELRARYKQWFQVDEEAHASEAEVQEREACQIFEEARKKSSILNLRGRLARGVQEDLLYSVGDNAIWVLNSTELQKLGIHAMRKTLAEHAFKILNEKALSVEEATCLSRLMHRYCEALKDLDYMKQRHSNDIEEDPFKLISSVQRDHLIMEETGLLTYIENVRGVVPDGPDDLACPEMLGAPRGSAKQGEKLRTFVIRLLFGVLGGVALVGPMVLMIFHKTLVTQVTTTGVATFIFAICMASYTGSDASPLAVVGTTAAYAAVLVVFVGTSS